MKATERADVRWLLRSGTVAVIVVGLVYMALWALRTITGPVQNITYTGECRNNLFRLARGLNMYAQDYDDRYPVARNWMRSSVAAYIDREARLHCPAVGLPGSQQFGYALNSALAGIERSRIADPNVTPLVFDSNNDGPSVADPFLSLPHPGRHTTLAREGSPAQPGNNVGFAAGNARILLDGNTQTIRVKP